MTAFHETNLIYFDDSALRDAIDALTGNAYMVVDPSDTQEFAIFRELQQPSAHCLFSGEAKESAGNSAPYLVEWRSLSNSSKAHFAAHLRNGAAIAIASLAPPSRLKLHLKKYLYENGDTRSYFQKYYVAINFLFFLASDPRFMPILSDLSAVLCRKFEERGDFVLISEMQGPQ